MTQRTPYRFVLMPDGSDRERPLLKFVKVRFTGSDLPRSPQRGTRIQAKTTPETIRQVESGTGIGIFRPKHVSV